MICSKFKHKNWQGAIKHIHSLKKKNNIKYAAYYCPSCNSYHVTSNARGGKKFLKFVG